MSTIRLIKLMTGWKQYVHTNTKTENSIRFHKKQRSEINHLKAITLNICFWQMMKSTAKQKMRRIITRVSFQNSIWSQEAKHPSDEKEIPKPLKAKTFAQFCERNFFCDRKY